MTTSTQKSFKLSDLLSKIGKMKTKIPSSRYSSLNYRVTRRPKPYRSLFIGLALLLFALIFLHTENSGWQIIAMGLFGFAAGWFLRGSHDLSVYEHTQDNKTWRGFNKRGIYQLAENHDIYLFDSEVEDVMDRLVGYGDSDEEAPAVALRLIDKVVSLREFEPTI